jgi:glucose-6-phosphate 1-dehydrogenase
MQHAATILVIFGATGDLVTKKIVPSLYHLARKDKLPKFFKVVGFSRKKLSDEAFGKLISDILAKHDDTDAEMRADFCKQFSYRGGQFENKQDYAGLAEALKEIDDEWGVCSNKLFYLAAPPQWYEVIFRNLAASGLDKPCSNEEGWSRILVEKPFGKNLATAKKLEKLLARLFKEVQIYRIDHYLAKEMIQNILAFRFSNNFFESIWDTHAIERVDIKLWERMGVEERGGFYDGLGALRDVGQNHLLQIVALLAMGNPRNFSADAIREKRGEILKSLIPPSAEEIKKLSYRAQYDGYRAIKGVASDSATETYFKTRAFLADQRWAGVPFILESGKRLESQVKEAIITFRHPTPCLCPEGTSTHYKNKLIITLEPEEKITLVFWSKKPGLEFQLQERDFSFLMRDHGQKMQYTEEYEKLLYDCIAGDQTLFVTSGEVEAMWKYTDPIIKRWQKNSVFLKTYKPGTAQPIVESQWIDEAPSQTKAMMKKEIAIVGLGKMGGNVARRLMERGWRVRGFNKEPEATEHLVKEGLEGASSLKELIEKLPAPRIVWLMVPSFAKASEGKPAFSPVDEVISGLMPYLQSGDIIIDGGNSFYKDSVERFKKLRKKKIHFIDVGVSGGPEGARRGASLMIGGERQVFEDLTLLFSDVAKENSFQFFEGPGAGHFVKMIHNGIEYGMMQAIAEGFTVLKETKYKLDLARVADVYNHGSVIESRLIGWLQHAIQLHGQNLRDVSGSVGHTGEGAWTVKTAQEMNVKTKVIEEALKFRINSAKNPSYTGKILSALREQFGGHRSK